MKIKNVLQFGLGVLFGILLLNFTQKIEVTEPIEVVEVQYIQ